MERIKEDELAKGMLPPVIVSTVLGDDSGEVVLLAGGTHPKMRFVDDAAFHKSFSGSILFDTTDSAISLKKGAGRLLVAVTAGGLSATTTMERFTHTAAAAGVSEDITVFEVEDDVVVESDATAGANGMNLVQLWFERIE